MRADQPEQFQTIFDLMHRYFIKTPWYIKKLFRNYVWDIPSSDTVYLSFDDGPHPEITPWVIGQLKKYNAKATFFCIGKNVKAFPETYNKILAEGHTTGNHTHDHLNGWKSDTGVYLDNIKKAAEYIDSSLFRPPYGRIKRKQAKGIAQALGKDGSKIIMWDVLSADFDRSITPAQCAALIKKHARPGSVIVFHDSEKAWPNLAYALPEVLDFFAEKGWKCASIQ